MPRYYEITNRAEEIDFGELDEEKQTVQNAKNLIMCRMGEIPYDRMRGLNPAIYEMPFNEARAALAEEISRALLWEPEARLVSCDAAMDADGELLITCVIDVETEEAD
jgi:hypothetical protein